MTQAPRKRGRPPVQDAATANLTIRLPEMTRARLEAAAAEHGVTVGALVREAIRIHLGGER